MKARQYGEGDLMDLNLRREFSKKYQKSAPAVKLLQWECGGLTDDIAYLTRQEIVDFHRKFYRPEKISIFLCGADWNEQSLFDALDVIDGCVKSDINSSICPTDILDIISEIPNVSEEQQKGKVCIVEFPTEDDSAGSVGFAWPGAPASDLEGVICFHILFKYLRETSSSPLQQAFVQIAEPWATDIDYEIKPHLLTIMTLIFSGVDVERGGLRAHVIKKKLMDCLQSCVENEVEFLHNIQLVIKSFELKLVELFEDDPHETVLSYSIPNIIRLELGDDDVIPFGSNIVALKDTLEHINTQPVSFWASLINYLMVNDPIQVILSPNLKLNAAIEGNERDLLNNLASITGTRIVDKASVPSIEVSLTEHSLLRPESITFSYGVEDAVNVVELPNTGLKSFTRLLNFTHLIPQELWVYLPLLQELLFQCDLDVSGEEGDKFLKLVGLSTFFGRILPYQQLQRLLNSHLNSFSSSFGMDNEIFSIGYCEQAMVITAHLPITSKLSLNDCLFIIDFVWKRTIVTEKRILVVAENLVNQIRDIQKDPYEVMDALLTDALSSQVSNSAKKSRVEGYSFELEISIFRQRSFLRNLSKNPCDAVKVLSSIQTLLKDTNAFLQVSGPLLVIKKELEIFKRSGHKFVSAKEILPLDSLPKYGKLTLTSGRAIVFARGDFTASYLSVVIPCNVLATDGSALLHDSIKEYVSIMLICQLLSVTEGPIYRRIRGRGLAYDASLTLSLWNGLLTLSVNDSVNPVDAFKELMELLREVDEELSGEKESLVVSESALRVAKSAVLFQLTEERSAPSSLATVAYRLSLRGIPMAKNNESIDLVNEACVACTLDDLRISWIKHFKRLLQPFSSAIVILAVPSGSTHFLSEFEEAIGMTVEHIELSDMFDGASDNSSGSEEEHSDLESDLSE